MQVPADNTRNAALNDLTAQVQNEKTRSYITTRLMPQMEWYSHEENAKSDIFAGRWRRSVPVR